MTDLSNVDQTQPKPYPAETKKAPSAKSTDLVGMGQKTAAEIGGLIEDTRSSIAESRRESASLTPPKLELPPQPTPQYRSPMEAFGSTAGLLAVLGGLITRRPIVASLNAAADVMQAYRAQDDQAARDAFNTWKVQTENAFKMASFEQQSYRIAIEKHHGDEQSAVAELNALGHAMENQLMAKVNTIAEAQKLMMEQARLASQLRKDAREAEVFKEHYDLWERLKQTPEFQKSSVPQQIEMYKETFGKAGEESVSQLEAKTIREKAAQIKSEHPGMSDADATIQATGIVRSYMGTSGAKTADAGKRLDDLINEGTELAEFVKAHPNVVGTRGKIVGGIQTLRGVYDPTGPAGSSRQEFVTRMTAFQERVSRELTGTKYMSKQRAEEMERAMPGMGTFESAQQSLKGINQIVELLRGAKAASVTEGGGGGLGSVGETEFKGTLKKTFEDLLRQLGE